MAESYITVTYLDVVFGSLGQWAAASKVATAISGSLPSPAKRLPFLLLRRRSYHHFHMIVLSRFALYAASLVQQILLIPSQMPADIVLVALHSHSSRMITMQLPTAKLQFPFCQRSLSWLNVPAPASKWAIVCSQTYYILDMVQINTNADCCSSKCFDCFLFPSWESMHLLHLYLNPSGLWKLAIHRDFFLCDCNGLIWILRKSAE